MHDIGNRMGFKVNQIGPVHPTVEGGYQAALALGGGHHRHHHLQRSDRGGTVLRFTADGVNVPGDVSVIGFDNTLIAPVVTPPITSIRIPRAQLGQVAVRHLLLMMISPMILLGGVFLWIPGMPFGIYVFACWRCTWEMTPETAGFGAHARGEKRDGHVRYGGLAAACTAGVARVCEHAARQGAPQASGHLPSGAGDDGHVRPDVRVLRGARLEPYGGVRVADAGMRPSRCR